MRDVPCTSNQRETVSDDTCGDKTIKWVWLFVCRCLSDVVQLIYRGLNDGEQVVRNAALFALGQLSEHLQVLAVFNYLSLDSTHTACCTVHRIVL